MSWVRSTASALRLVLSGSIPFVALAWPEVGLAAGPATPRPKAAASAMRIEAVPGAARRALQAAAQHHAITNVTRRVKESKTTYETTVMVGSTPWFIKVDADGKVLERSRVEARPRPTPRPAPRRRSGVVTDP